MPDAPRNMKITILGTGASSGIPTISCQCATCKSSDWRDKRLRCSVLIETAETTLVIDTSPDFRQQALRNYMTKLDAVLYTHHHFDHIGGFDDIRAFNYKQRKPIPLYLTEKTLKELRRTFIYAFETPEQIGGGVPQVEINTIEDKPFKIKDLTITPLPLKHGKLDVLGFRVGAFAYCTDANYIPEKTLDLMRDLDWLVLDALRFEPHSTHFCLDEAIEVARGIAPSKTYFTHMAHQIKHAECEKRLPKNMFFAYDQLVLNAENE